MLKKAASLLALTLALGACQSTPTAASSSVFWVEGAVACGGEQIDDGDTTLFEAVMAAEPVEASCDLTRVTLSRSSGGTPEVFIIDVQNMLETGDTTMNPLLQAGDIVIVLPKSR